MSNNIAIKLQYQNLSGKLDYNEAKHCSPYGNNMEKLKRIEYFTTVVEENSFSAAGRKLNIAKSVVSKNIKLLEQELGVVLLHRSTRQLSLTGQGETFYKQCREIINKANLAFEQLGTMQDSP